GGVVEAFEDQTLYAPSPCRHGDVPSRHAVLRPAPHLYVHLPRRHGDLGAAGRMEVSVLKPSLGAIERFVGMPPRIVGGIGAPVRASHGDPRREWSPRRVHGDDAHRTDGLTVTAFGRLD